eukprot:TRINITY_DN21095_c0_g1_i1.p1 TRINITY_DN21095_c0_g1~~TRINITY_DN21095_c0_g1_i1.p1  ORF type:complete len:664 (+),score=141.38 TRINITY_DN21095_c0_g1_i1:224-1993(+)
MPDEQDGGLGLGVPPPAAARAQRPRPQLTYEEALAQLREQYVTVSYDGGFELNVPGGIYGGYLIMDRVLDEALLPAGALDQRFHELQATRVVSVQVTYRILTMDTCQTLTRLFHWLERHRSDHRLSVIDFTEAWLRDEEANALSSFLDESGLLPRRLVLNRNCITQEGACQLVETVSLLLASEPVESRSCILDLRWCWIRDPLAFQEVAQERVAHGIDLRFAYEEGSALPGHLVVLVGPAWSMGQGRAHQLQTYSKVKEPWSNYMVGPAMMLAVELEDRGMVRWECPLCNKRKDINEHGAQKVRQGLTFGGILSSHLRGDQHRKNVALQLDAPLIVEFPCSYFFNFLSGAQGTSIEDAREEAPDYGFIIQPPRPTLPPMSFQPGLQPGAQPGFQLSVPPPMLPHSGFQFGAHPGFRPGIHAGLYRDYYVQPGYDFFAPPPPPPEEDEEPLLALPAPSLEDELPFEDPWFAAPAGLDGSLEAAPAMATAEVEAPLPVPDPAPAQEQAPLRVTDPALAPEQAPLPAPDLEPAPEQAPLPERVYYYGVSVIRRDGQKWGFSLRQRPDLNALVVENDVFPEGHWQFRLGLCRP